MESCDLIIAGAGLAGLSAAYHLQKKHPDICKVLVLEADSRVGGRLLTSVRPGPHGDTNYDLGAQFVFFEDQMMQLLGDLGIEVHIPQLETNLTRLLKLKNKEVVEFNKDKLPFIGNFKRVMQEFEEMSKEISENDPATSPKAGQWDSISLKMWLRDNVDCEPTAGVIMAFCEHVLSCEDGSLSLLQFLHYCKTNGGPAFFIGNGLFADHLSTMIGGSSQLPEKMADAIGRNNIHLNSCLAKVEATEGDIIATTREGKQYSGKYFLSAIPVHLLRSVHFEPPLPAAQTDYLDRAHMGNLITFTLHYENDFWTDAGFSGDVIDLSGDNHYTVIEPIRREDSSTFILFGIIVGKHVAEWQTLDPEIRKENVINSLVSYFGTNIRDLLLNYVEMDWSEEEFVGGVSGYVTPGAVGDKPVLGMEPCGRVYFSGSEISPTAPISMCGAVESGQVAAEAIWAELNQS